MHRVDQIEQMFFAEGPQALRAAALGFLFIGFAGGVGVAFGATNGFTPRYLWIGCIGLIPAVPCWLLSIAIRYRHFATVPLVVLLCAMSLFVTSLNPADVAKGAFPLSAYSYWRLDRLACRVHFDRVDLTFRWPPLAQGCVQLNMIAFVSIEGD